MPSPIEHDKLSKLRTGKSFIELHKWMNEEYVKPINERTRHDITQIPVTVKDVKEKFGNEAANEFLYHIREDYENNSVWKLVKALSAIKRTIFLPINALKGNTKERKQT